MEVKIEAGWQRELKTEFDKPYFTDLVSFVKSAYRTTTCYPPGNKIFNAFDSCPFDQTKVVILGQDPYFNPQQANGLCFSVYPGVKKPPSLLNIFKEREMDLNLPIPQDGDLSAWAKQGVLLLNATLTVEAGKPGSHQNKGWEAFTDAAISSLNQKKKGLVY